MSGARKAEIAGYLLMLSSFIYLIVFIYVLEEAHFAFLLGFPILGGLGVVIGYQGMIRRVAGSYVEILRKQGIEAEAVPKPDEDWMTIGGVLHKHPGFVRFQSGPVHLWTYADRYFLYFVKAETSGEKKTKLVMDDNPHWEGELAHILDPTGGEAAHLSTLLKAKKSKMEVYGHSSGESVVIRWKHVLGWKKGVAYCHESGLWDEITKMAEGLVRNPPVTST